MSGLEIFGIACAVMALVAFVGNEYHLLSTESFLYDALNFLSAVGLLYYAYETNAVPFMITNAVWALVSGMDVSKYLITQSAPPRAKRRSAR
jgi:chromate transport protein ChrA